MGSSCACVLLGSEVSVNSANTTTWSCRNNGNQEELSNDTYKPKYENWLYNVYFTFESKVVTNPTQQPIQEISFVSLFSESTYTRRSRRTRSHEKRAQQKQSLSGINPLKSRFPSKLPSLHFPSSLLLQFMPDTIHSSHLKLESTN